MADEVVVEAPVAVVDPSVVEAPVDIAEQPLVEGAPGSSLPSEWITDSGDTVIPAESVKAWVAAQRAKTIDSHEVSVGWTAQQGGIPSEPEAVPGTVVTYAELPYKASLEAAGVDVEQYHAGLDPAVVADDAERDAVRGVGTVPAGVPVVVGVDPVSDATPVVFVVPETAPGEAPAVVPVEVSP